MSRWKRFKKAAIEVAFSVPVLGGLIGFSSGQFIYTALISIDVPYPYIISWTNSGLWFAISWRAVTLDKRFKESQQNAQNYQW